MVLASDLSTILEILLYSANMGQCTIGWRVGLYDIIVIYIEDESRQGRNEGRAAKKIFYIQHFLFWIKKINKEKKNKQKTNKKKGELSRVS